MRISNPDEKGIGQILIRGDNVMKGYYRNDEATQNAIKNGWFYSGDLGYLDEEGYLFVKERLKEIIVLSSGKNISPEEVEIHYRKARSVKDICVLAGPGEEKLVAVVIPDFNYFKQSGESNIHQKIKWDLEYISQSLPPYRRIKDFVLIDKEFPKTRLDKIKRHEVRQIYQSISKTGAERKTPVDEKEISGTEKQIIDILKRETGKKEISLDDHSELDLGIDSMGAIQLMTALEEKFGILLKEDEFPKFFTVGELSKYMEEALSKKKSATAKRNVPGKIFSVPHRRTPSSIKLTPALEPVQGFLRLSDLSFWIPFLSFFSGSGYMEEKISAQSHIC